MAEPIVLEWLFPQAVETQWMLPPAGPGPVAAVVGPPGKEGEPGADGAAQIPEILDGGNF